MENEEIPEEHKKIVLKRIEEAEKNPEGLLDWDEVTKDCDKEHLNPFDAKKFNGILKVDEDALIIQKQLRNEWD